MKRGGQDPPKVRAWTGAAGGFRGREPDHQDLVVSRGLCAQGVHGEKIGGAVRVDAGDGIDVFCGLLAVHLSEDGGARPGC